jgi:NAD-dependent dihydropyrimidine dehydrogenase PreA subunit
LLYPKADAHRKGNASTRRIGMAYVIAEPCIDVKDKACVDVCPVDCIYEGPTQLFIHPTSASTAGPASRSAG